MDHQHAQDLGKINRSFGLGIVLNIAYVIVEVVFGLLTGSLALLADAGHNAGDVLGLGLAWVANLFSQRPFNQKHTYGWRNTTVLAALLNSLILMVAVGGIVTKAVDRLVHPQSGLVSATIIWVALAGAGINLLSAFLFQADREKDLNARGAFIHMAADAGVSAGVALTGLIIRFTGWNWLDPIVSLVIAVIIFWGTKGLLLDSFHLLIGGVPRQVDLSQVKDYLSGLPGVENVHDLHVWGLSTREIALTAHLVKPAPDNDDRLIERATEDLRQRFEINHITLQWERERLANCR